jgi:hypothetical protein
MVAMTMPDEHGQLNEVDNDLIERWWSQHSKDSVTCPVCKTTDWKLGAHLVNVEGHAADVNGSNRPTYPHVIVTCKSCAHSMLFNAVQIGIATPRRPSDQLAQKGIVELTQSLADSINKSDADAAPSYVVVTHDRGANVLDSPEVAGSGARAGVESTNP